jgi:hypothetical protein
MGIGPMKLVNQKIQALVRTIGLWTKELGRPFIINILIPKIYGPDSCLRFSSP